MGTADLYRVTDPVTGTSIDVQGLKNAYGHLNLFLEQQDMLDQYTSSIEKLYSQIHDPGSAGIGDFSRPDITPGELGQGSAFGEPSRVADFTQQGTGYEMPGGGGPGGTSMGPESAARGLDAEAQGMGNLGSSLQESFASEFFQNFDVLGAVQGTQNQGNTGKQDETTEKAGKLPDSGAAVTRRNNRKSR